MSDWRVVSEMRSRRLKGPMYCKGCSERLSEHLHWVCLTCGYRATEPTQDDRKERRCASSK